MRRWITIGLLVLVSGQAGAAEIQIKGGCVLGRSQSAHGLSAANAETRIRQYARRYVESFSSFNREKRDIRRRANAYMELDKWTQDDVVGFTLEQRRLLLISISAELAVGKIDSSELPGYIIAIDRKIDEIEVELGCESAPD